MGQHQKTSCYRAQIVNPLLTKKTSLFGRPLFTLLPWKLLFWLFLLQDVNAAAVKIVASKRSGRSGVCQ
eukprot:2242484-Amphidinium_carterae.1